ncbi:hypothetical protein BDIM_14650 [Brevundimonas diminuta ATCC 11568]|nr:hypothetical protein BDIM_14650 [Brevundimonas diminuta ATCC 11568]
MGSGASSLMFRRTFNFSSPFGVALLVGLAALVLFLGLNAVGLRFDPFHLKAKRADRAEAAAQASADDAGARRIEAAGAADTVQRIDRITVQIRAADAIAHQSAIAAQEAPDANSPVDPARLDRLQLADRQLCELRPALCSDAAAPARYAGSGAASLRPAPPS